MNFLAAHPSESFTLTEIAAHLGLSNGSAHRVLTTLAESRYLSRHPKNKTYSLGMALVAIGQAASTSHRDLAVAKREIARLADALKVQCVASAIADGEMLMVACAGTPQSSEPVNQIGERRPFIPPLGMGHVAWADAGVQAEYLARAPAALNDKAHERLALALQVMSNRGYGIAASGPAIRALRQFTHLPVGYQEHEYYWAGLRQLLSDMSEQETQLLDLDEVGSEGLAYITAPVFAPSGQVVLELSVSGLPADLSKSQMEECVDRLRAAAAVVTRETHGRPPAALSDQYAE